MFSDIINSKSPKDAHIDISIGGHFNINEFIKMLAWAEILGSVGHSTSFKVGADGDGSARPIFKFKDNNMQKLYVSLQKELVKEYINHGKDIESFEL